MMRHLVILFVFFSIASTNSLSAQTKATQKEKFQTYYDQTKTLTISIDYKFVGQVVYDNERREPFNDDSNVLIIKNNELIAYLKALNNLSPLQIKGKMDNYDVNFDDDKQMISITLEIEDKTFQIDIKPNGKAFLAVDNITQVGEILGN